MKFRPITFIEKLVRRTHVHTDKYADHAQRRYPLIFSAVVIIGVMFVMYGFESIIERVAYLAERPGLVFVIGFFLLLITGSLYKDQIDHHNRKK